MLSPHRLLRTSSLVLTAIALSVACTGTLDPIPVEPPAGEVLGPGEFCEEGLLEIRIEPSFVVVAPCTSPDPSVCSVRKATVVLDPDVCATAKSCDECKRSCENNGKSSDCSTFCTASCPVPVTFTTSDAAVVAAPPTDSVSLHRAEIPLTIRGGATEGAAEITVSVPRSDGTTATATLAVDVLAPTLPICVGPTVEGTLAAGEELTLGGGARISLPEGAGAPNSGSYLWSVEPFEASLGCGTDAVPPGHVALGPAIELGPVDKTFQREIPIAIPLNPARLPDVARWRHLRIAHTSPAFPTPRPVAVADPRVEKIGGDWVVTFKAPRLGTYQAVVPNDAGTKVRSRRLTHRAAIGVSMGGGGTAMFGMRHHDLFDVIAPLGGPVDWTWLLHYIENNNLGGFRPIAPGTQLAQIPLASTPCTTGAECAADETCLGTIASPMAQGRCTWLPKPAHPYEHTQTFNTWWFEYPRTGTGGRFPRAEYAQIFRDLALLFGNPNSDNLSPNAENLPAGVHPDDKSQTGDHPNGECKVWIDPIEEHPDKAKQDEIAQSCPMERCAHTLTLTNYFDDEYNPDGTFPVITVCDGSEQNEALSPYANTWTAVGNNYPLELALAVDYNANGVRDELEPIIRAGHEPWDDWGTDGLPSVDEPGYVAGVIEDPTGDDYHPQFNPGGTEGDHRWEPGEPFRDVGLDGVAGTQQQPAGGWAKPGDGYDVGEGDGKFTAARGLARFWDQDSHSVVNRKAPSVPGGEFDDEALHRLDVWTDGGTRDLFNFAVDAQHLTGAFAGRGRDLAYFTDFTQVPGLDPSKPDDFRPTHIVAEDLQGIVLQRYGKLDPSPADVDNGSGQHVGTANEVVKRIQAAVYFIGSRWREPELRQLVKNSADMPAKDYPEGACEIDGNCQFDFTDSSGRTGPVGVTLPPGYAHAEQQSRRYPVIYFLHGYGQQPQELTAAIVLLGNWMSTGSDSIASRLPKAITVFVDGRCRVSDDGKAECIRGGFYGDSVREDGFKNESWWLELIDHVDKTYRTMGPSTVEWVE